jgi:hypothetical protein
VGQEVAVSDIDRIAEILRAHRRCAPGACTPEILATLIVQKLSVHRRIETVEQLDALPFLTIVREVYGPSASGCDYGAVWERRTNGWECIAGTVMPPGYESPRLPCRVLYRPEVDQWGAR